MVPLVKSEDADNSWPASRGVRKKQSARGWVAGLAVLIPICLWSSYAVPLLITNQVCAYRDAGHYYFPWWCRLARLRQQTARWVPLWEPAEDLGRCVAADPTAAVYYPLAALASLPVRPAVSFALYLGLHYALALAGSYWVLRRWAIRPLAAVGGALAYAFGGYLIAQHANLPYLVSGSWLPLAFYPVGLALRGGGGLAPCRPPSKPVATSASQLATTVSGQTYVSLPAWLIGAGAVAMMILGGDPQTALHVALVGLVTIWPGTGSCGQRLQQAAFHLLGWAAWCAVAVVLAMPQLAASLHLLPDSSRTARFDQMPLAYETREAHQSGPYEEGERGWQPGPEPSPRPRTGAGDERFRFGFPAWRSIEWLWGNSSGKTYPVVHRWSRALGERDTWFPSVYQGALVAAGLLAVGPLVVRCRLSRWMLGVLAFSVLAAAGQYGLGSLANAVLGTDWPGHWGSLSSLLVRVVPGYGWFRYPSKWMVMASWCAAYLAAAGWDRLHEGAFELLARRLGQIALVSFTGLVVACLGLWLFGPAWESWLNLYRDTSFGPIDPSGARRDLLLSLLQTEGVCLAAFGFLLMMRRSPSAARCCGVALLLVHTLDLALAHRWQWVTLPAGEWQAFTLDLRRLAAYAPNGESGVLPEEAEPKPGPVAVPVALWRADPARRPERWASVSSPDRMREIVRWERDTLYPKFASLLESPISVAPSSESATVVGWLRWIAEMQDTTDQLLEPESKVPLPPVDGLLMPVVQESARHAGPGALGGRAVAVSPHALLVPNPEPPPIVQLHRKVRLVSLQSAGLWHILTGNRTRAAGKTVKHRQTDVVTVEVPAASKVSHSELASHPVAAASDGPAGWRVVRWEPQRIELDVCLESAAWLVLRQSYDSWWRVELRPVRQAEHRNSPAPVGRPVCRAGGLLLATHVPSGYWHVRFDYRMPYESLLIGGSVMAWLAVGFICWADKRPTFSVIRFARMRYG
ncbi:MAG: hypothetical protein KatS3mg110_0985 [Pirellulaceae bacterium]|nr:MAG: hypothetical protein KatS3mg110_0985 [Pirellulaceae bacterium]